MIFCYIESILKFLKSKILTSDSNSATKEPLENEFVKILDVKKIYG